MVGVYPIVMDVRNAHADDVDDVDAIRSIARASLTESYGDALHDEVIDTVVQEWYDSDDLAERLDGEGTLFLVAESEAGGVVGFAQCYLVRRRNTVGEIDWIHVDPKRRGEGVGKALLDAAERELVDRGAGHVEGRVLEINEDGIAFYETNGYESTGQHRVEIGDETFDELLYTKLPDDVSESQVLTEARTADGQTVYVARDEGVRASEGPFYPTYLDRERTERFGWFCGNCESFNAAVDTMDRIQCNDCGNKRKASRWDAAYL